MTKERGQSSDHKICGKWQGPIKRDICGRFASSKRLDLQPGWQGQCHPSASTSHVLVRRLSSPSQVQRLIRARIRCGLSPSKSKATGRVKPRHQSHHPACLGPCLAIGGPCTRRPTRVMHTPSRTQRAHAEHIHVHRLARQPSCHFAKHRPQFQPSKI